MIPDDVQQMKRVQLLHSKKTRQPQHEAEIGGYVRQDHDLLISSLPGPQDPEPKRPVMADIGRNHLILDG